MEERSLMTGLFRNRDSAERGYNALTERGYTSKDVNVVMSDDTRQRHFVPAGTETELGNKAAESAGASAATGGLVGALVGWGLPEERVKRYDEGIRNGGILIGFSPRNGEDAHYITNRWASSRAEDVYR